MWTLQRHLAWLGFEPGRVDGRYGPLTTGAVKRFQYAHDLSMDGQVGPHTATALRANRLRGPRAERIKALQCHLIWLGFEPGPIDGRYGTRTADAVKQFQQAHNLKADGRMGPSTVTAIRTFILERPQDIPSRRFSQPSDS